MDNTLSNIKVTADDNTQFEAESLYVVEFPRQPSNRQGFRRESIYAYGKHLKIIGAFISIAQGFSCCEKSRLLEIPGEDSLHFYREYRKDLLEPVSIGNVEIEISRMNKERVFNYYWYSITPENVQEACDKFILDHADYVASKTNTFLDSLDHKVRGSQVSKEERDKTIRAISDELDAMGKRPKAPDGDLVITCLGIVPPRLKNSPKWRQILFFFNPFEKR